MSRRPDTTSNRWEDYLEPEEKLLWQGAPAIGIRSSAAGVTRTLSGLVLLGFLAYWIVRLSNFEENAPIKYQFLLIFAPFLVIGLWMVAGHWFFDAYKRKHSRYALTSKRALIARSLFKRKFETYEIAANAPISLTEGKLDTVNFAQKVYKTSRGTKTVNIGFRYIEDGSKVFELLKTVRKSRK